MPPLAVRRGARAVAAALAATVTLLTAPVAAASPSDGMGSGTNIATDLGFSAADTLAFGMIGVDAASMLMDTTFSLGALDPVTGSLSGPTVTSALTADYANSAMLADTSFLAIDTARMAADAQRQAAEALAKQRSRGGLKNVPSPYDEMIQDAVSQFCPALDPSVLAAQLAQESGFRPDAQSGAGAQGIAQFMPDTWAAVGVDGDGDGVKDPLNPADAIPAAAKYDCQILNQVRNVPGDATANMLAGYNAGPGAVLRFNGIPPYAETQQYVAAIQQNAERYAADDNGQTAVGPDGCPTAAPGNTLRDGSSSIGVHTLCVNSVAQARTPQAAMAIKWALTHLGIPYSQAKRMTGRFYDCSSFVFGAYKEGAGVNIYSSWAPTTRSSLSEPWAVRISYSDVRPGDLVEPQPGHIAMVLSDGYKVHTNMDGDVSKVEKAYTSAYWSMWIDPSRV